MSTMNTARLARIERALRVLPRPRAVFYARRVKTAIEKMPRGVGAETEWDLWLANELDRIYKPVVEEIKSTGAAVFEGGEWIATKSADIASEVMRPARETISAIGWPIVAAGALALAFMWSRK